MANVYTPQELSAQNTWKQYQAWLNSQYSVDQRGYLVSSTQIYAQDYQPAPTYPYSLAAKNLEPNLHGVLIPIFGSAIVLLLVNLWPNLFYMPVVVGLVGIIFLWLTQPNK